jgi:bifunctional DNA-binding transcriptional regulator/antitoxin component of YhaV-PrlF toxin-antitoxin module
MAILRDAMPMKFTVTVTSVGTSSVIVMPKPVLEGFGLRKGDQVDLYVSDDGVYIPLKAKHTMANLKELKSKVEGK